MDSQIDEARKVACLICGAPKDEPCVADDGTEIRNGVHMGRISEGRRLKVRRVDPGQERAER